MRLFIGILALTISGLLVAACQSSGGSGLTGKTWQWTGSTTSVRASQSVVPDPENYRITFNSDGTFSAKVDCNQVAGAYTTSGSDLTITPGPSTLLPARRDPSTRSISTASVRPPATASPVRT
jgi:heat shock protein HslJ